MLKCIVGIDCIGSPGYHILFVAFGSFSINWIRSRYHVEVSAEFISTVTEKVNDDVRQWQGRPLDSVYPVVFFDALRVNIRKDGVIKKMAVHLALGVRSDGRRDVLGMWVHENEGAAFWTSVFTELKNRGVEESLMGSKA